MTADEFEKEALSLRPALTAMAARWLGGTDCAEDLVQDAMLKSISASPAWQSLAAVRSGHVYFLPQELFLLSPGIKYPQAAEYMAKLAYPEKFE